MNRIFNEDDSDKFEIDTNRMIIRSSTHEVSIVIPDEAPLCLVLDAIDGMIRALGYVPEEGAILDYVYEDEEQ